MNAYQPWLNWAVELQSLAQAGLHYSKDPFDVERFQRIREISAEMIALKSGLPEATVQNLFCGDSGYQTPKLDVRCAVFQEGRILLVRENEGGWTLPGGWMDVGLTVGENAAKEAREEAGVEVRPRRIIAVLDWQRSNCTTPKAQSICKIFVQCDLLGGHFNPQHRNHRQRLVYFVRAARTSGRKNHPRPAGAVLPRPQRPGLGACF